MSDSTSIVAEPSEAPAADEAEVAFDWRACWYPVTFLRDLPRDKPYAFSLYDEPLVLFFDNAGNPVCLRDRCAHRSARLSDGNVVQGRIECFYHGWQFDGTGQCAHIPQLPEGTSIPTRACVPAFRVLVRQGIVWLWAGDPEAADPDRIPIAPDLDSPDVFCVDFQMDLPYDQSYLIENVIDVAHIHIAHDGVRGGGLRSLAKPLEFDIKESSIHGIRSGFRTLGPASAPGATQLEGAQVEFVAPNLIRFSSAYKNRALIAGLSLYSIPHGKSRCRLLYRKYSNFLSWRERWKPRWLEHWTQCLILEQDMSVVVGQYETIERSAQDLRKIWFPIKTSDRLVVEYRRWLDKYGAALPFYRGFVSAKPVDEAMTRVRPPSGRFAQHTQVCTTCATVHRRLGKAVTALWYGAGALAAVGVALAGTGYGVAAAVAMLVALGGVASLKTVKRRFE